MAGGAAARLGKSQQTIHRWIEEGRIPVKKQQAMETKKPRGRRPTPNSEYIAGMQAAWPRLKTNRSLLNKYYENRALGVIDEMQKEGTEGLEFLVDTKRDSYRWGVLRELGKSSREGTLTLVGIRSLALQICQEVKTERQTAREWVHRVKLTRHRLFWETVSKNNGDW